MSLINITKLYFQYFSEKDIQNLELLFSENIRLVDWEINVIGKKNVIEANKKIFNSVDSIKVTPLNIFQDKLVMTCEIDILINKKDKLKVVDIIKFDEDKKIISISAYKQ